MLAYVTVTEPLSTWLGSRDAVVISGTVCNTVTPASPVMFGEHVSLTELAVGRVARGQTEL